MAASTDVTPADAAALAPLRQRSDTVAALTGLRGLAALEVVLIHSSGRTEYPWLGVESFGPISLFVLSGFLLYRPWARWVLQSGPRPSVRTFARHRVARIFPAYWLVLVVVAVVLAPSRPLGADGWLRAVVLGQIYSSDGLRPGFEQVWSLGTEASWYVALPVLALSSGALVRRLRPESAFWVQGGLILLALPVTAGWRWAMAAADLEPTFTVTFWLPAFLACFGAGALVAHLVEGQRAGVVGLSRVRALASDEWTVLVLAGAAILVATSSLAGPDGFLPTTFAERQTRNVAATVLALALLLTAAMSSGRGPVTRVLSTRWLTTTGRWSYGLYLWHLPVIEVMNDHFAFPSGPAGLAWRLLLVLAVAMPLSAATYAWVERPAITWSRGTGLLGRPVATTATAAQPTAVRERAELPVGAPLVSTDPPVATPPRDDGRRATTSSTTAHASAPMPVPVRRSPPGG